MTKPAQFRRPRFARLALASAVAACGGVAAAAEVSVSTDVIATVGDDFLGLQYSGPTHRAIDPESGTLIDFPSAYAHEPSRQALQRAGIGVARLFVEPDTTAPEPGVYDWSDLDTAVDEIVAAGMKPMLVLHQRDGAWRGGSPDSPWWLDAAGRQAWRELAGATAARYADRVGHFEVLNEPNHLCPTSDGYLGFDVSADIYLDAAAEIRAAAPQAKIGGPASFGSWEPATWAKRVLSRPGGEAALDFVSYHVYGTESATASDEDLLERARWWETSPNAIRAEIATLSDKPIEIALTEFNASAVWRRDGELWTDPRNVDAMGGLMSALGWLYSARGGADMAMRFATTGGYGVIQWAPDYELRPAYYATRLLHEHAGFGPGAELLGVEIDGPEGLDAFALREGDAHTLILINTATESVAGVEIDAALANADGLVDRYVYDATRTELAPDPVERLTAAADSLTVDLSPRSVTVLRAASVAGDFNGDGQIDAADLEAWRDAFGTATVRADGNGDGFVDAADYTVWRDTVHAAGATPTPEASGLALAALAGAAPPTRRSGLSRR